MRWIVIYPLDSAIQRLNNRSLDYILLYPDKTIVQTLPGSSVPYTLNKYKEELGKPFPSCTFGCAGPLTSQAVFP